MRLYHLSVGTLVKRFLLIMTIIVGSGFAAKIVDPALWYIGLAAFPVFLSCLLGIDFDKHTAVKTPELRHHFPAPSRYHRTAH